MQIAAPGKVDTADKLPCPGWGAWLESPTLPGHRSSGFLPGVKQTFAVPRSQAQSVACGQGPALPGNSPTVKQLGQGSGQAAMCHFHCLLHMGRGFTSRACVAWAFLFFPDCLSEAGLDTRASYSSTQPGVHLFSQ